MSSVELSTLFALIVVGVGSIALALKLMLFALAIDDWWEVRGLTDDLPERMVARDEILASAGRVISVLASVVVGLIWFTTVFTRASGDVLRISFLVLLLLQPILALIQGTRSLIFRRQLARAMSHLRSRIVREMP